MWRGFAGASSAADVVAAFALGRVEAGVGIRNELVEAVDAVVDLGDAQTDGESSACRHVR
jgi:hypothetical protein